MDPLEAAQRARQFVQEANSLSIPVNVHDYVNFAGAKLRLEALHQGESGYTIARKDGTHVITVNCNDTQERQRFTICHEIAHIKLGVPSNHSEVPIWAYAKRDPGEVLCDTFAEEILMPYASWNKHILNLDISQDTIENLRSKFDVSYPAAGSRLATLAKFPCAFVTTSGGLVRHMARSTVLRTAHAWVGPRSPIPVGTVAYSLRLNQITGTSEDEIPQDRWFENWGGKGYMWELARNHAHFDTATSLLWFEEEELDVPETDRFGRAVEDDGGLAELTGQLPWPGKGKRRP